MDSQPLFFGRLLRILTGAALLIWLWVQPPQGFLWQGLLLFLGISLVVGGAMAYAGCEVLAIPNLLSGKRMHCY
jgi:hypothetical protein